MIRKTIIANTTIEKLRPLKESMSLCHVCFVTSQICYLLSVIVNSYQGYTQFFSAVDLGLKQRITDRGRIRPCSKEDHVFFCFVSFFSSITGAKGDFKVFTLEKKKFSFRKNSFQP